MLLVNRPNLPHIAWKIYEVLAPPLFRCHLYPCFHVDKFVDALMRQNKQVYAIYFNFQFAGLADHDNYHEFCRLLGRFKVNYQVPILLYED